MRIPSGTTDQPIYFFAADATDGFTPETGLTTFTVYRARNGGASAAMDTPTIAEVDAVNMPGVYALLLDEDMTLDAGDDSQEMVFYITHAGMRPVVEKIELYRPKITLGETSTAQTGDAFARLGAPAGASIAADVATVAGYLDTEVAAILAAVDTEVAAIKAKTDNLPDDPADASVISGLIDAIPTANENADALLDRADAVETSWTPRQALRIILAALAGKASGLDTTSVVFRNVADTKDRITATVDANGNRTAVTLDAS